MGAATASQFSPKIIIVGAGPVGLALAIELGHRSVPCLLVERNDRVGYAPRAKTTNVRTREHFRRWGIADKLRAASPFGVNYPSNVLFVTRLGGYELTRFENAFYCAPGRNPLYSEHSQWIPQYKVEEVMREHAQSLPCVQIRFNCELQDFTQNDSKVSAQLRNCLSGELETVQAHYLVGTDGARSTVRTAIGASMQGTRGLSRNYNIVFRAPGLTQAHQHGPGIMYWQVNGDVPSLIGPMDEGDKWFFMPTQVTPPAEGESIDARALIAKATGIDLPYEVLSTDEWVASRLISDRYRDGRVFLAGDACHVHPPFGGYGMNMGVADGVDLGWKLAAVLQGWGGENLLNSYEIERRPIHQQVMDEAVANHATLGNQLSQEGLEDDSEHGARLRRELGAKIQKAKMREFTTLGVMLGYRYDNSPLIINDGSPALPSDYVNYVPSSRPGALAPHAWLHDGSSLYDHFGLGFTLLLDMGVSATEIALAKQHASSLGIELSIVQTAEVGVSSLYPSRFTLIRPDQHVAWRGDQWDAQGLARFKTVTGRD